uniref:GxGYxYP putative glycoside hydrolase C-terminal domain-containing protein n=1 Tax=Paramoeba aestuarina TaxID=180227 RepID=A0A7S4PKQ6_9EUKA|mmetsp:Transcript_8163/g.12344  ORF Transcript_8163/g.12344 Transcript_8163/m.12344 type:complete len:551 (+) Transcript_8163:168-1820(+)|eukprot:CAMPEP_0201510348 /NCGR_PEP_ID=MMETSP0161_2-20130828/3070_1 /ASSEMBLY_ACC=CAM_ASM_000251 /TAXON_ID=180227 /ORGANISM="Neoparamoeba aestuarina, Strain SoJaBio B1-5/56/2" /LENGTH=550 /DNA_ID=CAMNT_0047905501 /DNA_START=167 /DNA_END=1819 /DNA_ORIENTATION=-
MSLRFLFSFLFLSFAVSQEYTIVNITENVDTQTKVAVQAIAGLYNVDGPNVFVVMTSNDEFWLQELIPVANQKKVELDDYLQEAFSSFPSILYDLSQENQMPSIVTLAGTKEAIPATQDLITKYSGNIILNTTTLWTSPEEAVNYTITCCLPETTSLAIQSGNTIFDGYLVDWIVKEKLFTQYLKGQCLPKITGEKSQLKQTIDDSNWALPVRVYGYNNIDKLFGGDVFEAETDCIRSMGQIASSHTTNLAFLSQYQPFKDDVPPGEAGGPMIQTPTDQTKYTYNSSKTYVGLVYGDMDNLDFVQSFGSVHMRHRNEWCTSIKEKDCYPFTWTLSPNLLYVAPSILRWYYSKAIPTERDWFIMPPSGSLYSYPGLMSPDDQAAYVEDQNKQAYFMNSTGSVHWEWLLTWGRAWETYFPRYISSNGTRFFFLNDVPWKIPIPGMTFLYHEDYRIIGPHNNVNENVIGFKPAFNWQLNGASGGDPGNSTHIAGRINNLKIGSVQYVYIIQNTPLEAVFKMVAQLEPHVQLVNYEQLADLAVQHHRFHLSRIE